MDQVQCVGSYEDEQNHTSKHLHGSFELQDFRGHSVKYIVVLITSS